jgi:hypothetical protein
MGYPLDSGDRRGEFVGLPAGPCPQGSRAATTGAGASHRVAPTRVWARQAEIPMPLTLHVAAFSINCGVGNPGAPTGPSRLSGGSAPAESRRRPGLAAPRFVQNGHQTRSKWHWAESLAESLRHGARGARPHKALAPSGPCPTGGLGMANLQAGASHRGRRPKAEVPLDPCPTERQAPVMQGRLRDRI